MDNKLRDYLKETGYNLIAFPNNNIQVFDILLPIERTIIKKAGDYLNRNSKPVTKTGNIGNFFSNDNIPLPKPENLADFDEALFTNKTSDTLDIDISSEYTKKIIDAFDGKVEGNIIFNNAAKSSFAFNNVKSNSYSIEDIGSHIHSSRLNTDAVYYEHLKNNQLYVIYAVAKTNNFCIEYFDKSNNKLKVNIEEAKTKIKGNISIGNTSLYDSKLYFKSKDKSVVFAFKAAQLIYEGLYFKINPSIIEKLKKAGLLDRICDNMYVPNTKIFKNKTEFYNKLEYWQIKKIDILKYKDIIENYCCFDRFTLKPKDKLITLGEDKLINLD